MTLVKSQRSVLIRRSCGHILVQRGPQKSGERESEVLGRSHGGVTKKPNAAKSDTFLTLRFILTAGACHDGPRPPALIAGSVCQYVIADAAYD